MRSIIIISFFSLLFGQFSTAQIVINQDTLVGNEWIDYSQSYYKMLLAEDGVYRVSYQELVDGGVPVDQLSGDQIQLYYFGEEIAIKVSSSGVLSEGDYIEFYGVKNRGELDQYIYRQKEDALNPLYSLYTDTSAYFLTWDEGVQGKRIAEQTIDISNNTLDPEPFFMHRDVKLYSNKLNKPSEPQNVRYSQYVQGEGYAAAFAVDRTTNHKVYDLAEEGSDPYVELRLSGNNLLHTIDITANDNLLLTSNYVKGETKEYSLTFDKDILSSTTSIKVHSYQSSSDRNCVAYSILNYPRAFSFRNESEFYFDIESSTEEQYIEIKKFDLDGGDVSLYDLTNNIIYTPIIDGNKVKLLLPTNADKRNFYLVNNTSSTKSVTSVKGANFYDYSQIDDAEFIILSSHILDKNNIDGTNYLRAYADYRASEQGGGFAPAVVMVEDLYDQFAYGVHRHALSIKNFTRWSTANWPSQRYYFIVGKGIEYGSWRTEEQTNDPDPVRLKNIVPTFGVPGSDNTLMSKKNHSQPRVPTGRLSATNLKDIKYYYDKVVLRESPSNYPQTIEGRLWTKDLLHLAGGDDLIKDLLSNSLANMGNILAQSKFGASVLQIEKRSSEIFIEQATTTRIMNRINEGISILSFFGHAGVGTFDFTIEKPSEYENKGNLPLILSMGCYSGNIFTTSESISEDFVLEEEVGAIAFMASSGSAYISSQGDLGQKFYTHLGDDYYKKSIGDLVQLLLEKNDTLNNNSSLRTLNEQFTFHGDPAIKIPSYDGPDYLLSIS